MITTSFKFKGHECFRNEFAGLDDFKPITVIIGRNNTGKSQLIQTLGRLTTLPLRDLKLDYLAGGVLDEQSLRSVFRENRHGGELHGYGSHWEEHGQRYINQNIEWTYSLRDNSVQIVNVTASESRWANDEAERRKILSNLVSNAKTPLNDRNFRRLLADRDMRPESASSTLFLDPDGTGATNIIRRFVLAHDPAMREKVIQVDLLKAVSQIFGDDGQFTKIELRHHEEGDTWEVFLGELGKGLVPLTSSGSGLKTVILVLLNLLVIPEMESRSKSRFVFAFEELENNLHPALLRRLLQFIADYVDREKCMLFLTTHSNVALDFFGLRRDAQIVHVSHNGESASTKTVSAHFDHVGLLTELGSRPSDLLQANGVLWLEGPSDRIYMNRLIELYSDGELREGRDYQCAFYGGSILANTTFSPPDEADDTFTNLVRLNNNVAVICDGDRTAASGAGSRIKARVQRIKHEVEAISSAFLWITEAKEMENYIPGKVWSEVYGILDVPDPSKFDSFPSLASKTTDFVQKHLNRKTFDKCDFAMRAIGHIEQADISQRFELDQKLVALVAKIREWNQ